MSWYASIRRRPAGQYVLGVIAALFAAAAVAVHFWQVGTSQTVVAGGGAKPASVTTVHQAGSDAFQLGLLGFAAVFALATVFYGRLSSITLPGGIGIKLTPQQKEQASKAVARQARARASQPAAQAAAGKPGRAAPPPQPRLVHLPVLAATPGAPDQARILQATNDTVEVSALAAQHTAETAETLLRLARTSPDSLRVMAETMGLPQQQWPQILTGVIPDGVWDVLAGHALDQIP